MTAAESETWLWPEAVSAERHDHTSRSEVVGVHPRRAVISADTWLRLIGQAGAFVDTLVYAGLFLPEQTPGVNTGPRNALERAERKVGGSPGSVSGPVQGRQRRV